MSLREAGARQTISNDVSMSEITGDTHEREARTAFGSLISPEARCLGTRGGKSIALLHSPE